MLKRLTFAALMVLALLSVGELTLHNHALIPAAGAQPPLVCGVCAFGADHVAAAETFVAATLLLLWVVAIAGIPAVAIVSPRSVPARAPPRALS